MMWRALLVSLCLCSSAFGHGFGYFNQPFLADPGAGAIVISNLSDAIIWVKANLLVTNISGTAAGEGDPVATWGDLTTNHYNLSQLTGTAVGITNRNSQGPNGLHWISFGNTTNSTTSLRGLTNGTASRVFTQPNTFFFVVFDVGPLIGVAGGCALNGYTNQFEQWNWSTGGENISSGNNQVFVDNAQSWSTNWQPLKWKMLTIQFNGSQTLTRVNGVPWPPGGTNWTAGANSASGMTLGSYFNFSLGSIMGLESMLWVNGSRWTNTSLMLQVEEAMGREAGLTIP